MLGERDNRYTMETELEDGVQVQGIFNTSSNCVFTSQSHHLVEVVATLAHSAQQTLHGGKQSFLGGTSKNVSLCLGKP